MHEFLAFLLLSSFWGGSFIAIKAAIAIFPPLQAAFLRVLTAIVVLSIVYTIAGKSRTVPRHFRTRVWLAGIFAQGLPFSLLFWGERSVSPGMAGILNGTVALWTFALGLVLLPQQEPFSWRKVVGLVTGMIGIVCIFAPSLVAPTPTEPAAILPALAVVGMAVSYGIGTLLNRRILSAGTGVDVYANAYQQCLASLTYLGVLTLVINGVPTMPVHSSAEILRGLGAVFYLGVCSTAIAFLLYFRLIREWGAVRAASVNYLLPGIALVISFLATGEIPTHAEILGAGLILGGVLVIQLGRFNFRALANQAVNPPTCAPNTTAVANRPRSARPRTGSPGLSRRPARGPGLALLAVMCTPATKEKLKAALREMADEAKALDRSYELALTDAFDELEAELKGTGQCVRRLLLHAPIPEGSGD